MKQTRLVKILAAGASCATAFSLAFAQDTSTTTTTAGSTGVSTTSTSTLNGSGTITTYTPGSDYMMFRREASAEPVKYYYSKSTAVVDGHHKDNVDETALLLREGDDNDDHDQALTDYFDSCWKFKAHAEGDSADTLPCSWTR